ncbi:MAG: hypothetical protein K6T81_04165 [Alicyclobacillus macrosporangiidus]|uniref:hypothetical protein n=1 Tax=Alicyclobacillus macrosporangiidus TaxID=392015 RepID=UPI0026EE8FEF|nr:hypothetical protein [Alicyclobacillus macrosporangiidus]MCL6597913.1 hypothetical protein [Alicyclobacillus macrosporangiidus]
MRQEGLSTPGRRWPAPPKPFPLISREELRRLCWEEGRTDVEIAQMFGVTANEVNRKRRQMNLVQGALTSSQWSEVVRTAEMVKSLPWEAVQEVRRIVDQYRQGANAQPASGMHASSAEIVGSPVSAAQRIRPHP